MDHINLGKPSLPEGEHPLPKRLSVELQDLSEALSHSDFTIGELMNRLEGRVYSLFLVLLALPFCQPISLPGLSTPFGLVIALLGIRFAFKKKPWVPKRLLKTRIPDKFLPSLLRVSGRLLGWFERLLHPRMTYLFDFHVTQLVSGLAIACCGAVLLLPLPIPFSNMIPALPILMIAWSISERDGVMLSAGFVAFLFNLIFFGMLLLGGKEAVDWIQHLF